MPNAPVHALPTEPLLELPTKALRRRRAKPEMAEWLVALFEQGHVLDRSDALFRSLRKHLLDDGLLARLEAVATAAASGDLPGVAALAALVAVRAPGDDVIERLREFSALHRIGERYHARVDRGEKLERAEKALLDAAYAIEDEHRSSAGGDPNAANSLPHPRDIGIAGAPRQIFARIVDDLQRKGNLGRSDIDLFIRVAELELSALEQRASALAGDINPYSSRHVRQVMPLLSSVDMEVRDMRAFMGALAADGNIAHFNQQQPVLLDQMDSRESELLLEKAGSTELLSPLRRLLLALRRNPLTLREVSYYLTHLYRLGDHLVKARVRKETLDPLEGTLMILEFTRDRAVRLPVGERASAAIAEAIAESTLPEFQLLDGELLLPMDPSAARRISPAMGLPLPPQLETEGELPPDMSIKDLVMANINNTSVLAGLLKNSKVVSTPGIVELIVTRCRSMVILETICQSRPLHAGYVNKGVPLALIRSPMRISIKTLRKFINVRYVNKMELRRISVDHNSVRREVVDEATRYLKSLN